MQADGNLVIYGDSSNATWATGTVNRGAYAIMQGDGNFVVYNWNGALVWSSNTYKWPGSYLRMQDDGNLVIYTSSNQPVWDSDTYGTSLGQSPCHRPTIKTAVEYSFDRSGGDYQSFYLNRPSYINCAYFCSQDSQCQAFTYVPPDVQASSAVCYLKNSVSSGRYQPGTVSGRILRD